jgi:hypothetical protein
VPNASEQLEDDVTEHLDGNALAGPLTTLFAADVTAATVVCAGCGHPDVVAAGAVYGAPMGLVLRCVGCGNVLMRYAETSRFHTLDLRGIAALRITTIDRA